MITLNGLEKKLDFSNLKIEESYCVDSSFGIVHLAHEYEFDQGKIFVLYTRPNSHDKIMQHIHKIAVKDNVEKVVYVLNDYPFKNPEELTGWTFKHWNDNFNELVSRDCENYEIIELQTIEDFIDKANSIRNELNYDKRIEIPLDISKNDLFDLMYAAHLEDVTLNTFVERCLRETIAEHKSLFYKE